MTKIKQVTISASVAFVGGLVAAFIGMNLHKNCPMSGAQLAVYRHAGEEMPQYCACKLVPADVLPVQVYTCGEDGKPLPESPQPRDAYFIVKHNTLRHDLLVFFRWKDEMNSPAGEE